MHSCTVFDALILEIEGHGQLQGFQGRLVQQNKLVVILAGFPVLHKVNEAPVFVLEQNWIGRATELRKIGACLEARRDIQLGALQTPNFKWMPLVKEEGGVMAEVEIGDRQPVLLALRVRRTLQNDRFGELISVFPKDNAVLRIWCRGLARGGVEQGALVAGDTNILQAQNVRGVLLKRGILLHIGYGKDGWIGTWYGREKGILRSYDPVFRTGSIDSLLARMVIHIANIHHQLTVVMHKGTRRGCEVALWREVQRPRVLD